MRSIDADALKKKVRYSMLFKMGFINHCADAGRDIPEEERKQILDSIDLHKAFIELIDGMSVVTINDHADEIKVTNCNDNDLISRQQAIKALTDELAMYPERYNEGLNRYDIAAILGQLPSSQSDACENACEIERKSNDLISRQDAIDALHNWFRNGFDEDKWWNSTHVLAAIEGLPSVQQDHKWETCFECPLAHGCPKIKGCTNEQAIEYASQIPNDCPLSTQPEILACGSGELVTQPGIIHCKDCVHQIKEWREDKRLKENGYWVYACKVISEICGYWAWFGQDEEFCSEAERRTNE